MDDAIERCEYCEADSGRTVAGRDCCQVRMLAKMPSAHRDAAFKRALVQLGSAGLEALKGRVRIEYKRLREKRSQTGRKALDTLKSQLKAAT